LQCRFIILCAPMLPEYRYRGTGCSVVYVETAMTDSELADKRVTSQLTHYAEMNCLTI